MQDEAPLPDSLLRNVSRLAASANERQRQFMEQLAERQREPNHSETSVEDAEEFFKERQEAVSFLKQLSDAGCGQFLTGRRGRPTRIEWAACGAIPIAKAFVNAPTDGSVAEDEPDEDPAGGGRDLSSAPSVTTLSADLHPHRFLLRPGLTVEVELPLNLTNEEANRLAEFIRAIPF